MAYTMLVKMGAAGISFYPTAAHIKRVGPARVGLAASLAPQPAAHRQERSSKGSMASPTAH